MKRKQRFFDGFMVLSGVFEILLRRLLFLAGLKGPYCDFDLTNRATTAVVIIPITKAPMTLWTM